MKQTPDLEISGGSKTFADRIKRRSLDVLRDGTENTTRLHPDLSKTLAERLTTQNLDMVRAETKSMTMLHPEMFETATESMKRLRPELFETAAESMKRLHPELFETATESMKRLHPEMFETAAESMKRLHPEMFETAAESMKRLHPELFETAAERMKRRHSNLLDSIAVNTAKAILEKPISSHVHLNAFLAPVGVDVIRSYEAKQKVELQSLFNSVSAVSALNQSKKMLTGGAWEPLKDWPEIKPRFLGMDLHDAIEADDSEEIERIMTDPAFGIETIKAMHQAAKMSVEEREVIDRELTEAIQTQNGKRTFVLHAGIEAMAKENTIFSNEKKEEIRTEFLAKKMSNPALSADAIYGLLVKTFGSSNSTIRRIVCKK